MSFSYLLEQNTPDSHQSDPWWFAVIIRFKHVQTFSRNSVTSSDSNRANVSLPDADENPVEEREPLILTNQITGFTVTHSKSAHTSSAAFRVVPGAFQFDAQTHAGDWLMFWAFDNRDDYDRVLKTTVDVLRTGEGVSFSGPRVTATNGFMDGLKFLGRLNAPKRERAVDPSTGVPHKAYELTAVGFGEFDAKILYTASHHAKYNDLRAGYVAQIHDLISDGGSKVDDAIKGGLPIRTEEHAQVWLETFLGAGPGIASKGFDPELVGQSSYGDEVENSLLQTPNDIFLVPPSIGRLLGIPASTTTALRYFDLLSVFMGVQGPDISGERSVNRTQMLEDDLGWYSGFLPQKVGDLSGSFLAQYMQFGQTTVWDLIYGFSNAPVNEMFLSLRVNSQGKVAPAFILRQSPLSSVPACSAMRGRGWAMTAFIDLPRWVVSSELVTGEKVGPSDSLHFNYVQVQGIDVANESSVALQTIQNVLSPPMMDSADIKRSGLRPYIANTNSDISGAIEEKGQLGRAYTQFMADIVMDQHLKWSGSLALKGIQEPISVGDNLEFDGILFHIEGITHSGHVDGTRKSFDTSFQLSNGISALTTNDNIMPYETVAPDHIDFESRLQDQSFESGIMKEQEMEKNLRKLRKDEVLAEIKEAGDLATELGTTSTGFGRFR